MIRIVALILLVAVPAWAMAAGRTFAVLVGVSQYPNLDSAMWLDGPHNDVQLFSEFLRGRGVAAADLKVLADGVPGAGDPNKKAILAELDSIATRAQPGDLAFLMFAGHGSQQPAKADDLRNEPDGLDEIFLPRDVGKWDGEIAALPNALTDNELGAAIGKIRDRGVFVWAVFDNCHSGTITRAMPLPGEKDRQVKPEALGMDPKMLAAAAARAAAAGERTRGGSSARPETPELDRGGASATRGGFVAFYAAQSQETTPEASLPLYAPDAVPRGLFSYTLYQVLSTHPDATYRQAIEQVLQSYQGMGRQQPTPTYEGTGLDNVVFGATPGQAVTQWRVENDNGAFRLRAGLIHQVTAESILAVVPLPTSKDSEAVGYVKVTSAASNVSEVVPVEYAGKPAPDLTKLRLPAFARPVDLKVDFSLRVALPAKSADCEAPSAAVSGALKELQGAKGIAQRVRWVAADEQADVRLCQAKYRLLFLDGSASLAADPHRQGPAIDLRAASAAPAGGTISPLAIELGTNLEKIGRVANLSRLSAGVGGTSKLEMTLTWLPKCDLKDAACSALPQVLDATSRPTIHDGDKIKVSVTNPLTQPVDLTILYVDAFYGITAMYPDAEQGDLPRIEPHARIEFEITANADPSGFERMLVIGIPVTPQAPQTSFAGLAQPGIAQTAKRGGSSGGLLDMFEEAAFGSGTTGATRGAPRRAGGLTGSAEITTYSWTVAPR